MSLYFIALKKTFPSPPPWGWSTGFITTPLTTGRLPSQHLDPALPKLFWFTPTLPTCPTVAKQFWDTKRTSPDGNLKVADLPSFAMSFATTPAALANHLQQSNAFCWLVHSTSKMWSAMSVFVNPLSIIWIMHP